MHWRQLERERYRRFTLARVANTHGDVSAAGRALDAELATEETLDQATLTRVENDVDAKIRNQVRAMQRFHVLIVSSLVVSGDRARSGRRRVFSLGPDAAFGRGH